MPNVFDQFDPVPVPPQPMAAPANPFDQFDQAPQAPPLRHTDGRLTEYGWEQERKALEEKQAQDLARQSLLENAVAGYGRSLPSMWQGAKQAFVDANAATTSGAVSLLDALGAGSLASMAANNVAIPLLDESKKLREQTAQERRDSADLMSTFGGKAGQLLGDIANTMPAMGYGLAAKGATAARAIGQAALSGAAQGAIQPVVDDGERLRNTAVGAGVGGGLAGLGRGAIRLAEEVLPSNAVSRALNFFGARANRDPFAAEGEALAQRTGIPLTPGMVSGSRAQTGAENMARQSLFSADTAFKADERIADAAIRNVNRVMERISPDSVSPQGIGEGIQRTVRDAVSKIGESREQVAAKQFGALRNMIGDAPVVDYAKTKQTLQDIVSEYADVVGSDANRIRTQAQNLLEEIGQKEGYSLDAARRARSFYGRAARNSANLFDAVSPDINARLAKRMYGAMSDDLDAAGARMDEVAGFGKNAPVPEGTVGQKPSELLRQSNDDYRRHSQLLEAVQKSPLKRLLGDQINVDDFMTVNTLPPETVIQRVGSMKPSELSMVRDFMQKNAPDTWQQYKRMLVEDALAQAQSTPASAGAKTLPFNANGFVRALGGDKPDQVERLKQLFAPGEMSEVMDAMQAARRMGDKFGANFSGTGPYQEVVQALRNFTLRGLSTTASTAMGFNRVARMMLNSDGRRALIELARAPAGSKQANDLVAQLAAISAVNAEEDKPLEISIKGGRPDQLPLGQ